MVKKLVKTKILITIDNFGENRKVWSKLKNLVKIENFGRKPAFKKS